MHKGTGILPPRQGYGNGIARQDPAATPYVTLHLGLEIGNKMFPAEMKAGISLE
ncbi:MAG: hypothetical protein MUC66_04900 [Methanolinea sp.]|nr:hypothetical protein [Methanolinea sp.]